MPIYVLTMMIYFDNFSLGAWLYFTLHGSYGVFWMLKDVITPDKGFARNISILSAATSVISVLGPYCIAGYMVCSGASKPA